MSHSPSIEIKKLARELTLQLLFQREFSESISSRDWSPLFEVSISSDLSSHTQLLLNGIVENIEKIDSQIQSFARHWKLERMSLVDKNVLRLGTFEMLYLTPPLPGPIAINECIDLAKKYGTTDSGAFVNGILDQISKTKAL